MANSAVSDTNGKLGVMLGSLDSESITSMEGSIAWPIQDHYGFASSMERNDRNSAMANQAGNYVYFGSSGTSTSIWLTVYWWSEPDVRS